MIFNINNPALVILFMATGLFTFISLLKYAFETINIETLYTWRKENKSGITRLENLIQNQIQSVAAFSILKYLSLIVMISTLNIYYFKEFTYSSIKIVSINIVSMIIIGLIETLNHSLTKKNGPLIAYKLYYLSTVLSFLLRPLTRSKERIIEITNPDDESTENRNEPESSKRISIQMDDEGEPLEDHEVKMIRGVFQLDRTTVREIMIPRVDMITSEITTTIEEISAIMLETGHSKVPIYKDDIDHIEGIAHSMDVLRFISDANNARAINIGKFLRTVLYVPESKTLEDLLTEFQEKRMQMAIVIDEYGGVSGLVTVEDLLEEIVGEIHDEFDSGEAQIKKISDEEFHIDARIDIDDLRDTLGIEFKGEGFDTIGGFVLHQLGKIPSPSDSLQYNGFNIEVLSTVGRRIKTLKVKKLPSEEK
ncbi:MAG: hemolysin family protein [Dehalococcoidia bacterium]